MACKWQTDRMEETRSFCLNQRPECFTPTPTMWFFAIRISSLNISSSGLLVVLFRVVLFLFSFISFCFVLVLFVCVGLCLFVWFACLLCLCCFQLHFTETDLHSSIWEVIYTEFLRCWFLAPSDLVFIDSMFTLVYLISFGYEIWCHLFKIL